MASNHFEALVDRLTTASFDDTRIAAAFVGGSRGADTADEHADLDLYLILRDDMYDDFFSTRRDFMGLLGDLVFLEDFNGFGFDMLLFIFGDGVEGELVLARASAFEHIPSGPFRALMDRDRILPPGSFPPIKQRTVPDQREELRWLVHWFWRDLSQLSRWMARGRLWSAYAHLEMMRHTCLNLARLKHYFTGRLENYHKIEPAADAEDLACFQRTFCTVEREAMLGAVRSLIEIYLRIAPPLAAEHGIAYPAELHNVVLRRLEEACAGSLDTAAIR